ncbi:MAG TPA: trehalose-6-phosphate synthase [Steroidobacteraceae bacterium]|jgi:trehalose 6-phosphate synthase
MTRVVFVSNRLWMPRKGAVAGGLAIGVMGAMRARGGLWVGWNGEISDQATPRADLIRRDGLSFAPLELSRAEYEDYYLGFSNTVLWPLFHYFLHSFQYSDQQYESYQSTNRRIAQIVAMHLRAQDCIWVHDYHFLPLGQKLRDCGVASPIGFFLHIPFPSFEVLRVLPAYAELLNSMLAYDLIGFQTTHDRENFLAAARAMWGADAVDSEGLIKVGAHCVQTGVFPIGVDVAAIQQAAEAAQAGEPCRRMVSGLLQRRLIIGVDRLDYSKGLVERFRAYERFLESYPENRGGVTLLQIAPLSRTDVQAYSAIRNALEQASGRTNGRFADTDWTPIRYLNRNVAHSTLMGYLRAAQVGLVTPVRDGMNLVAKEFVAAQNPLDPGVLVLSCLAGAAQELSAALLVNPYDQRGVAHALQSALAMPRAERCERHHAMLAVLSANDINAWHRSFLDRLMHTRTRTGGA